MVTCMKITVDSDKKPNREDLVITILVLNTTVNLAQPFVEGVG